MPELGLETEELWRLGVALAIGLVVGGERERHKGEGPGRSAAGIRTFALVALLGAVASLLGAPILLGGAVFVGAAALLAYALGDRSDPGLTTEVALVTTYALGALAAVRPLEALAAGVGAATVLAARGGLHDFVRRTLTPLEVRDALVLGVAALVVLPLLPDRYLGPLDALNPRLLWKLAVVMMAVSAAGHVAQRALGPALGLAFAGLAGGFVSSAATIGALAGRARQVPAAHGGAVAGASASTIATYLQLALVLQLAAPPLLARLAWPLAAGGAISALYAGGWAWRAARAPADGASTDGQAFSVRGAVGFAGLVGLVGLLTAAAEARFGQAAVPVAAALAGLVDAHAAASSAATLHAAGRASGPVAALAVLAALSSNAATKLTLAVTAGTRRFSLQVGAGLLLGLAATWAGFLLVPGG